jgi:epoxyqueuosine reductase
MTLAGIELIDAARRLAAAEGLAFASALALEAAGDERLTRWLELGYAGEMAYVGRHERTRIDPAAAYAPMRSVLVFIAEYETAAPLPDARVGNIARYALGDDYHDVLKTKLFRIADGLRRVDPTLATRALVDTAPLLEKIAAARAGLGWQGKHTNLLREDRGSWFFLAELLVDREVPAPAPAKDRCGVCTACIPACPTGAIVAPYVLDSRRCISYLTIELRGPIPVELRPLIGNRIFGCDDCQEACPWNRFARESPIRELRARPLLRERTLIEWLEMAEDEWRAVFRGSAVKRAKYAGFKRNVAVALGNSRDVGALPALRAALAREPGMVGEHLEWAIARIEAETAGAGSGEEFSRPSPPASDVPAR